MTVALLSVLLVALYGAEVHNKIPQDLANAIDPRLHRPWRLTENMAIA